MKLVLKREPFLKAFSRAAIAAPARSNKEVLTNVLLTANGDSSLQATDLEIATRISLGAEEMDIDEGGKVLLPAAMLKNILHQSSDELLRLNTDKGGISILGQRTRHKIQTGRAEDFPALDHRGGFDSVILPAPLLAYAARSIGACAGDSGRFDTSSLLVEGDGESLLFVATEGHICGWLTHKASSPKFYSMVPQKAARLLATILQNESGNVEVFALDSWLRIQVGGFSFLARLAEGRLPNVQKEFTIPTGGKCVLRLPAGVLKAALSQATLVDQVEFGHCATFRLTADTLSISCKSETGEAESEVPIQFSGEPLDFDLNWKYLSLALAAFDSDKEIEIRWNDMVSRVFITHGDVAFVVVPLSRD